VVAKDRHEALKKAEETLRHADANQYQTELKSIAHVVMLEANGCEWMVQQPPDSKFWKMN
jgi:hypothetical protein